MKTRTAGGRAKVRKFDLKALAEEKKRNFEQRLRFVVTYAEWVKKTPNKVWSRQQNEIIG